MQGVSLQQLVITLLSVMLPPTKCSIAPAHPGPGGGSRLTTACEVTNYTDNERKISVCINCSHDYVLLLHPGSVHAGPDGAPGRQCVLAVGVGGVDDIVTVLAPPDS